MSRERWPDESQRDGARLALVVTLSILVAAVPMGLSSVPGASVAPAARSVPALAVTLAAEAGLRASQPIVEDVPGGVGLAGFEASDGHQALFSYTLANGSAAWAVFDGKTGSITEIQVLAGGFSTFGNGIAAVDHQFLILNYNGSTGVTAFETYSNDAGIQTVTPNISPNEPWSVAGTGGDSVFLSAPGFLVALDDKTFQLSADYSSLIPAHTVVPAVGLVGHRLYVGGGTVAPNGGSSAFLGYIDLRTLTLVDLSPAASPAPGYSGFVESIVATGNRVYFGGLVTLSYSTPAPGGFRTGGAVLEVFTPRTGKLANLSSTIPPSDSIAQLVDLGDSVGAIAPNYNLSFSTGLSGVGAFYVIDHHLNVENETSVVGSTFLVIAEESSVSAGLLFMAGADTTNGATEVGSFPVGLFSS